MTDSTRNGWLEVQEQVLSRIQNREWKPGELIPNEVELAEEFGCARATVNRALQEIADQGLIDRRRKAGTRVSLNPVRRATFKIPILRQEIEESGSKYGYKLLSSRKQGIPVKISKSMKFSAGTELLHVRAIHEADGSPYAYEDRWINHHAVPEAESADFEKESANEWLVRHAPFSSGNIKLSAISANWKEAELLGTVEGSALMALERITQYDGLPITWVRLLYRAGYTVNTDI